MDIFRRKNGYTFGEKTLQNRYSMYEATDVMYSVKHIKVIIVYG